MNKKKNWENNELLEKNSNIPVSEGSEEIWNSKKKKINFDDFHEGELAGLIGNVDVLKRENTDERYTSLNRSFLKSCKVLVGHERSLMPLFLQYNSFVDAINESNKASEYSPGNDEEASRLGLDGEFSFSLADFGPFGDQREFEYDGEKRGGTVENKNGSRRGAQHKCSRSEMYRFLVRHFGVPCPNISLNDDFVDSIEAFKKTEKMAEFPFSKPLEFSRGSGMSFSLSRREDIGNHNRKVFEAITALRKDKNALGYIKNPRFFEESSEEDEVSGNNYTLRENVVCSYYNNGRYVLLSNLILRAFSRDNCNYINMRSDKGLVFKELDRTQAKIVHSKGEDVVYILVMKTMIIYRLICRHPHIALKIYGHLMGSKV